MHLDFKWCSGHSLSFSISPKFSKLYLQLNSSDKLTQQTEYEAGSEHQALVPGDPVHVEAEQSAAGNHIHRDPGHRILASELWSTIGF